jgi:hypothetical protein
MGSMFSNRLKELRKSIKATDVDPSTDRLPPTNDSGQFDLFRQARGHNDFEQSPDLVRPELIYSMDLDGVLGTMKRARSANSARQSNNFYHACLDRID